MTPFSFKQDIKLTDFLKSHRFTLSAEVIPPRNGSEQRKVLEQIELLIQAGAQFLAVTKGAGGSLRGGSLPIAQAIKENFNVPCIAHFTCRDLSAHDVENQLVDHHYFGVRNILALRGDPPDGQPHFEPRPGGHSYAYQLIEQIRNMNAGVYLSRPGGPTAESHETTDFCIGAAAYPEFPDARNRIEYFRIKVAAGAHFGITDLLFDPEVYARFVDDVAKAGANVPILPGTRLLRTKSQAERVMKKFKVNVPPAIYSQLADNEGPDALARGLEITQEMALRLKHYGAPGLHLYVIVDTLGSAQALQRLSALELRKDSLS